METDGSLFSILHGFPFTDGASPVGPFVHGPDNSLYGVTHFGGAYAFGTIFKVSADGSSYNVLHDFRGSGGAGLLPNGLIMGTDGALYGTTSMDSGNTSDAGTVFRMSTDGSAFSILHTFLPTEPPGGSSRNRPLSRPRTESSTERQRAEGRLERVPSSRYLLMVLPFAVIHSFDGAQDGGAPEVAPLVQGVDGALHGTNIGGGPSGLGTAFRVSTDGSEFSVLHAFQGSDGQQPTGGLVEGADGSLYGTALGDGAVIQGTVFAVSPDGSRFSILHVFKGPDGQSPEGTLVQGAHGALYGKAVEGGSAGAGVVFKIMPDGSGYSIVHAFEGLDGLHPSA